MYLWHLERDTSEGFYEKSDSLGGAKISRSGHNGMETRKPRCAVGILDGLEEIASVIDQMYACHMVED